jgi:hypothetical protein
MRYKWKVSLRSIAGRYDFYANSFQKKLVSHLTMPQNIENENGNGMKLVGQQPRAQKRPTALHPRSPVHWITRLGKMTAVHFELDSVKTIPVVTLSGMKESTLREFFKSYDLHGFLAPKQVDAQIQRKEDSRSRPKIQVKNFLLTGSSQ